MKIKQIVLMVLIVMFCVSGCASEHVFQTEITEAVEPTAAMGGNAFDKKCGWGLKKNKNAPPEVPTQTVELLAKYGAIYKDSTPRTLYLTFDEGYENGYTAEILDVLKENQVPAAFFVTGPYLKQQPELIKRMVAEGHIVGNHTVNHPSLPDVKEEDKLKNELVGLSNSFEELTGETMKFFRPPMGEYSERTLKFTQELGYINVFWSFAYKDWEVNNQKGEHYAYTQITQGAHDGAILLLHAVSKDNAKVLDRVIKDLKSQGYRFCSLEDFGKNVKDIKE